MCKIGEECKIAVIVELEADADDKAFETVPINFQLFFQKIVMKRMIRDDFYQGLMVENT